MSCEQYWEIFAQAMLICCVVSLICLVGVSSYWLGRKKGNE